MSSTTYAPQTLTTYGPDGTPHEYRPNKFGNKCALPGCGIYVPGGQGELTGSKQAGWKVQHLPGMCPEKTATDAPSVTSAQPAKLPHTDSFNGVTNTLPALPALPAQPYVPKPKPTVQVNGVGVFKHDGSIYVVKPHKYVPGKLEAWQLVESAPRKTLAGTVIPFRLVRRWNAIYALTEAERLTMADANEISAKYGKCICCNRSLYAADTITKCEQTGIWVGPDCRVTYFPGSV